MRKIQTALGLFIISIIGSYIGFFIVSRPLHLKTEPSTLDSPLDQLVQSKEPNISAISENDSEKAKNIQLKI